MDFSFLPNKAPDRTVFLLCNTSRKSYRCDTPWLRDGNHAFAKQSTFEQELRDLSGFSTSRFANQN